MVETAKDGGVQLPFMPAITPTRACVALRSRNQGCVARYAIRGLAH